MPDLGRCCTCTCRHGAWPAHSPPPPETKQTRELGFAAETPQPPGDAEQLRLQPGDHEVHESALTPGPEAAQSAEDSSKPMPEKTRHQTLCLTR